ncbi:14 kDa zinc-binding protein [Phtheirospermum japonicum]|uniref:14 kDa zinc-binding protein n=1 Tax=Phtheirospermum japonicum TaxID=374723 RepID=A0A830B892_9LAMI|nr:14 kDa zinc-binding protein [Phtheirospermum japonicum]
MVMSEYGFKSVLTIDEYASYFEHIDPLEKYKNWVKQQAGKRNDQCSHRVQAVFIVSDSVDWSRDIQAGVRHCEILGHLLYTAKLVTKQEGLDDGFRIVINDGPNGSLIAKGNLIISNAGDCRAVCSRGGVSEALTPITARLGKTSRIGSRCW